MAILDIIALGYFVNIMGFIIFTLFMVILSLTEVAKDPKKMLELKQLENDIQELKRLNHMLPWFDKYQDAISFMIPFSAIPKYYYMMERFMAVGVRGFTLEEIKKAKDKLEKGKK